MKKEAAMSKRELIVRELERLPDQDLDNPLGVGGRGLHQWAFATPAFARMQGMAALPIVVIPHPIAARPRDELREKVRKVHEEIRAALSLPD
jgi:predicted dienelactone hydrolase